MPETRHGIFKVVLLWWCWLVQIRANFQKMHMAVTPDHLTHDIGGGNVMTVRSKLQCCMAASVDPKAQYFCFKNPDVCTKYDVKVGAPHNPPSSSNEITTTCFSKHLSDCNEEGKLYVNDDCSITTCLHKIIQPYSSTHAPSIPFSVLLANECFHVEMTEKLYANARENCKNLGGDLYVPRDDFQGMSDYIMANLSSSTRVIIGAYNESWLDGRGISDDQWAFEQPSRNQGPIVTFWISDKLMDDAPDVPYVSICHKGVSYP